MDYFHRFMDYMHEGFTHINALQGIIIALGGAYFLSRWGRLWFIAIGATVVYILADMLLPVVVNHTEFVMPPLTDEAFWHKVLALYLGFIVAIAFFFFIKKNVLKGGGH